MILTYISEQIPRNLHYIGIDDYRYIFTHSFSQSKETPQTNIFLK